MMRGLEFTFQIVELHGTNIIVLTLNYADFEISKSMYSKSLHSADFGLVMIIKEFKNFCTV